MQRYYKSTFIQQTENRKIIENDEEEAFVFRDTVQCSVHRIHIKMVLKKKTENSDTKECV